MTAKPNNENAKLKRRLIVALLKIAGPWRIDIPNDIVNEFGEEAVRQGLHLIIDESLDEWLARNKDGEEEDEDETPTRVWRRRAA
jgi:hypothetical protein